MLRRKWNMLLGFASVSVMLSGCSNIQQHAEYWTGPAQASPLFWLITGLVALGLLGFATWALQARHVPTNINYNTLVWLVMLLIGWTFALYLVPAVAASNAPATERTWSWQPGETLVDPGGSGMEGEPYRGYELYVANGCATCHTLYVRPQDIGTGWAEGTTVDDVAQTSDYAGAPAPPLGTQRNGPDLTYIGRMIPDMTYQIDHLVDPRKYKPNSIMPTYRYLSERDRKDLAAYLVSLGNSKQDLLSGKVSPSVPAAEELSEEAAAGLDLYRTQGCAGCHSLDGRTSVGPTWQNLWGREVQIKNGDPVIADEAYLSESIRDPNAKIVEGYEALMPPYSGLTDDQIHALIEFIKTLSE